MHRSSLLLFALLSCTVPLGSCSKTPETPANARAFQVSSRTQLIGGPTALGDVGDFMLQNGEIRVVIQDKGFNRGAGVFGGSLIDADIVRSTNTGGPIGGNGNDSFGEMFPAFFLEMINPEEIVVVNDGSDGEAAVVEVRGKGGEFVTMLRYLNQLLLSAYKQPMELLQDILSPDGIPPDSDTEPNIEFRTRYILEPGARHVRVESTMTNVSNRQLELPPQQVLDLLAGFAGIDLGEFRIPSGHVLGFGKLSKIFLPGLGYDIELGLRDAGAESIPLPGFPGYRTPLVASTNENGVNYGFAMENDPENAFVYQLDQSGIYGGTAKPDDMLYLFNASGFGGVFTARAPRNLAPSHCAEGLDPQTVCGERFDETQVDACVSGWDECLASQEEFASSWTYTNYLIIGDGDVAGLWEEYYRIRDETVRKVRGRVIDAATGSPVPAKESVLIYENDADECDRGTIYSQAYTIEGGRFELDLPAGDYCARSHATGRPLGEFVEFTVGNTGVSIDVMASGKGRIVARVTSERGEPMPAKMTVVGVHEYYGNADPNYRGILMDQVAGEPHRPTDLVPDDENDPMTRRFIEDMAYGGADGIVEIDVRPGKYTVYLSRGLEYDVVTREVDVKPGGTVRVSATLDHLLDTTGHIGGDFHMHQAGSIDSGLDYNRRVKSVAAEGVELVVSTEHNYISDLEPYVYRNNLQTWLKSIVGLELTTFEAGHFNAFPIQRTLDEMNRGSFAWQEIPPGQIFDELREMAPEGQDNVIQVNHPRTPILGYFEQHNVDPFDATVELPINLAPPGLGGLADKIASPNGSAFIKVDEGPDGLTYTSTFSWEFDAIEIFNGPHLEELRHFRMPFDKDAAPGEPDALPEVTRTGLRTTMVTEADNDLNELLAEFLTEQTGAEVTEEAVEMLSEEDRDAVIDDWVHAAIPDQWSILCDGDTIVHPGGLDDWYNLLNYPRPTGEYKKYTATGNSDSHGDHLDPPGLPRNFFFVGHDDPERVTSADLVGALQKHHNIVSNGPFVDFTVDGGKIGSEVTASGAVDVNVQIRAVPWIGADRFRIVANGEVVRDLDPAQTDDYWGWVPIELDANGEFEGTYSVSVDRDTWFVVEVESDTSMFPIIEPQDIPPFNFADVIGSLAGAFGFGAGVEGLEPEFVFPLTGFAFTNPIWVVADGDGEFTPPSPPVFRCMDGVYGPANADPNSLVSLEEIQRVTEGRLRASSLPEGVHEPASPLQRPTGENRDLRLIFEAWGHAH